MKVEGVPDHPALLTANRRCPSGPLDVEVLPIEQVSMRRLKPGILWFEWVTFFDVETYNYLLVLVPVPNDLLPPERASVLNTCVYRVVSVVFNIWILHRDQLFKSPRIRNRYELFHGKFFVDAQSIISIVVLQVTASYSHAGSSDWIESCVRELGRFYYIALWRALVPSSVRELPLCSA